MSGPRAASTGLDAGDAAFPPLAHARVGLVGAGFMAKLHSFALRTAAVRFALDLPSVELRRVGDLDASLAQAAVDAYGWGTSTGDWREVTRADDVDVVIVATPVAAHAEVSLDALTHGKHVICEKPLAADARTALALCDAAKAAGTLNTTAFAMRRWPAVSMAKRVLDSGAIGSLVKVRAHYLLDWALPGDVALGWRFRRDLAGSGSIGDVGSHLIDLMRHLAGDVDTVYARTQTIRAERPLPGAQGIGKVDVDDAADLVIEFESGAAGLLETSWMAPAHKTDCAVELLGEAGSVRFCWERNHEVQVQFEHETHSAGFETRFASPDDPDMSEFSPAAGSPLGLTELFVLQAREVLRALRAGRGMSPNFVDGLRTCEIIDAAIDSSGRRCSVAVRRAAPASLPRIAALLPPRREAP